MAVIFRACVRCVSFLEGAARRLHDHSRNAVSLPGVAMSSIGTKLLNSLCSVERPGDFCVGGIREIFMPAIDVDGVGRIAFPILSVQAERLVAIAEVAPYGRGEATVVDREVRRTWQVDSAKARIAG